MTAISAGFCFLIALFFAPILASVPPWATGGTLVLVRCLRPGPHPTALILMAVYRLAAS